MIAKADTITISKIKAFTNYIDSLSSNDEGQKIVIKSIAEGKIKQEIESTLVVGYSNQRDTIRKTGNDGFIPSTNPIIYYLSNSVIFWCNNLGLGLIFNFKKILYFNYGQTFFKDLNNGKPFPLSGTL